MEADQQRWHEWAQFLHRRGLGRWVAALLEAVGPLSVLAAQLIYVGQPLLEFIVPKENLDALARLFDDPQQTKKFAVLLRGGNIT